MTRGNQREVQRERGLKRAEKNSSKGSADHEGNKGLTLEQRRARDAEILRQKAEAKKKAAEAATSGTQQPSKAKITGSSTPATMRRHVVYSSSNERQPTEFDTGDSTPPTITSSSSSRSHTPDNVPSNARVGQTRPSAAHRETQATMRKTAFSTSSTSAKNYGQYRRLQQHCSDATDNGYDECQFIDPCVHRRPGQKVPWRAITLATILSVLGTLMISIGCLLMFGYLDEKYRDRMWPVLLLGALMFIPGAYHIRIAYYAYCGEQGYSFDDIPDFD